MLFEQGDAYFIAIGMFFNMLVGMMWYSPFLFQDTFLSENHLEGKTLHPALSVIIGTVIFNIMENYGLLQILKLTGTLGSIAASIQIALFLWTFLLFPAFFIHRLYDGKSMKLTAVYASHHMATLLLEAFAMSYFK